MKTTIRRSIEVQQTPRVKQVSGLFDLAPTGKIERTWEVDLSGLPAEWHVGVVVGQSGAGKSTIAKEVFGQDLVAGWPWPADKSLLDGFARGLGVKDITGLLSSVGFSSPPAWLVPFGVLSNGQQFRANLARTLAEKPGLAVVDEFTSVVDRTVAKVGSAAVAKAVRRGGGKFVAVTCHYDVIDWLAPDWVLEVHADGRCDLKLNEGPDGSRGSLWRRPRIELEVVRTDTSAWPLFRGHHYLSGEIHRGSKCFVGLVEGQPAAFTAVLSFPHPSKPAWREHRTVCLPDFQGVGIGNAMSEFVASLFAATGKPYVSTTSHPAMIRHRLKSPLWRMTRKPGMASNRGTNNARVGMGGTTAVDRITAGFEFVGAGRPHEAQRLLRTDRD